MFEVSTAVVNVSVRNAVPMPIAPVVLPVDTAPAQGAPVVYQFDRPGGAKLDSLRLRYERGRLCWCRHG